MKTSVSSMGIKSLVSVQVVTLILGIIFAVFHVQMLDWISYIIAAAMVVLGCLNIFKYFKHRKNGIFTYEFTKGVLMIIFGIYLTINTLFIIQVMAVFFGFYIMINGVLGVQFCIDAIYSKVGEWKITLFMAVVNVLLALIVLFDPFGTTEVLMMYIGIFMAVSAVVNIVSLIMNKAKLPNQ